MPVWCNGQSFRFRGAPVSNLHHPKSLLGAPVTLFFNILPSSLRHMFQPPSTQTSFYSHNTSVKEAATYVTHGFNLFYLSSGELKVTDHNRYGPTFLMFWKKINFALSTIKCPSVHKRTYLAVTKNIWSFEFCLPCEKWILTLVTKYQEYSPEKKIFNFIMEHWNHRYT